MPKTNPGNGRAGGPATGFTPMDVTLGDAIEIARVSYLGDDNPDMVKSLVDASEADLLQGYTSYGRAIGEGRGRGRR